MSGKYLCSKINIFYLFGVSIDVDQSVVFQICPQEPTQQVGARFAALAATCVACEAAGAVATMPKVLKEIRDSNEASDQWVSHMGMGQYL